MEQSKINNILDLARKIYGVDTHVNNDGIVDDLTTDVNRHDKKHAVKHALAYLINRGVSISKDIISEYKKENCKRTGLYVGSFDPFTIGHANIVERAEFLFDKIVIGVGVNPDKHYSLSATERVWRIKELYKDNDNISVECYSGLTTELAVKVGADFIIKGARNAADFEYEKAQAEINKKLTGIETVILFSEPEFNCVSSSAYRQIQAAGGDASWMLPQKD